MSPEEDAMKRVWIVGAILSLLPVAAGFSQGPAPGAAPAGAEALAAILGQPTGAACLEPQGSLDLPGQHPGVYRTCSATATCNDTSHSNISCNYGGAAGVCSFQNQNCAAGVQGQVNCNGTITRCPTCPCGTPNCCICQNSGDCFACCKCDGGTFSQCTAQCG